MKGGDAHLFRYHVEAGGVALLSINEEGPYLHVLELFHRNVDSDGIPHIEVFKLLGHLTPPGETVTGMLGLDEELDGVIVNLTHVVLVQHIGRLGRVDGDKVIGGVFPTVYDDGIDIPQM